MNKGAGYGKNNFAVPIISVIVIIILGVIIVVASKPNHNDGKCDICGSKDLVIDTSSSEICYTCYFKSLDWTKSKR